LPQGPVFPSSHQPPEFEEDWARSVSRDASRRVDPSGTKPFPFLVGYPANATKPRARDLTIFRSLDRRQRGPEDRLRLFGRAALH
jgi:hypothetical protein